MAIKSAFSRLASVLVLALLGACAAPTPQDRNATIDQLALANGWHKVRLATNAFALTAYVPDALPKTRQLTIYIEGDGLSWESRYKPSADPTPVHATALELAIKHPGAAVYLARPCQATAPADWGRCNVQWWTSHRFGEPVIESSSQAIDQLKAAAGAGRIVLVGYSGGGAVAALLAARRNDVDALVTVAGTLDHEWMSAHHKTDRLYGSLNPADMTAQLQRVPQWHLMGGQDKIIPSELTRSFVSRLSRDAPVRVEEVADYGHQCCWADGWPPIARRVADWAALRQASPGR
ncbi:MAG: hypothetical protein RLZZ271_470 [Pseudomonadota bacterium]|jgi:alpha-beta hydrolase superfamily lysophospholipase